MSIAGIGEGLSADDPVLHILAPSGKHNSAVVHKRLRGHVDPHVNLLLPFVMQEAPLFDALLATCQASIALSTGLSAYNDRFFMLHRGRAMTGLRKKLESGIDTTAILSVTMLITCDYLTGDREAVAGHAKALQRMSNLRGELPNQTAWDRFVRRGVEAYKSIGYVMTGCLPNEDFETTRSYLDKDVDPHRELQYPQPPFPPEDCIRWSKLPPGFSDLILASQVSDQLTMIICAINEADADIADDVLTLLRAVQPIQAALQRFSHHKQANYTERCLAAGLLAYTFQFPRLQPATMFHDPPMQGFTRLFSVSHRASSRQEREALLWSHMAVEGFSSTRIPRLPGSREVFARALARNKEMRDWVELEPKLLQHFHTPEILERWRVCHANCAEWGTSEQIKTPSSSLTVDTTSTAPDLDVASPASCPFTGQIASTVDGQVLYCPFRPAAA